MNYARTDHADGSITFSPLGVAPPAPAPSAPPPAPAPSPSAPPPAPAPTSLVPRRSTPNSEVLSSPRNCYGAVATLPLSMAAGVNAQFNSLTLNDANPSGRFANLPFIVAVDDTGERVLEFNNAAWATNAPVHVAISRVPDDSAGASGFAFPARSPTPSGNLAFTVNGNGQNNCGPGLWYVVAELANAAVGQADRLFWIRDAA